MTEPAKKPRDHGTSNTARPLSPGELQRWHCRIGEIFARRDYGLAPSSRLTPRYRRAVCG